MKIALKTICPLLALTIVSDMLHVQVLRIERVLLEHTRSNASCFCFQICKSTGIFHIVNNTEELLFFVVAPDPNQLKLTKMAVQVLAQH